MAKIDGVQEVAISELKPYSKNAKKHGTDQVDLISKSIEEFGFLNPILIDADKNIIAGHGRLMAASKLNMKTVPCIYVEGLSEKQYKAYVLADNKLTELGEWDMNLVTEELEALSEMDFDISLTGFNLEIDDGYGTDFELPSGDKSEICQMTFTLHQEQKALIEYAISVIGDDVEETFGNTNKNGNALYEVVRRWRVQET